MASSAKEILLNQTIAGAVNGSSKSLGTKGKEYLCSLVVSSYSSGTVNSKIQHSPDGSNWADLVTFTGLVANGVDLQAPTVPVLGFVRAITTSGNADVRIDLNFSESK
tara:strand:+ start:210 stop:533 length:324 start_codon:yes stop_codon:yes gene_type:complete